MLVGVGEFGGLLAVLPGELPDRAGFLAVAVGVEPVADPAVGFGVIVLERIRLIGLAALHVQELLGRDDRRPVVGRIHQHRREPGLADHVVIGPLRALDALPVVATLVVDSHRLGLELAIALGVDRVDRRRGHVLVDAVDGVPSALLVDVVDERGTVAVGLVAHEVQPPARGFARDRALASGRVLAQAGLGPLPGLTPPRVLVLGPLGVALDHPEHAVVDVGRRPFVAIEVEVLVLEGVAEFVGQDPLIDLDGVGVVAHDDDPFLDEVVVARDDGRAFLLADVDRVGLVADQQHRLEHRVVEGALVVGDVGKGALGLELLAGNDLDLGNLLERQTPQRLEPGGRPRRERVEFGLVQSVLAIDVEGLVVPVAPDPADRVVARLGIGVVSRHLGGTVGDEVVGLVFGLVLGGDGRAGRGDAGDGDGRQKEGDDEAGRTG